MPGRLQAVQPGLQPGAQGCRAEQLPAVAQGLCAGAGTLPPARLSTQLPGELPRALRGDVWGEEAPRHGRERQGRAGQGRGLLLPQLLPGAGGSQLHCMPECFQGHFARGETRLGFSFSFS